MVSSPIFFVPSHVLIPNSRSLFLFRLTVPFSTPPERSEDRHRSENFGTSQWLFQPLEDSNQGAPGLGTTNIVVKGFSDVDNRWDEAIFGIDNTKIRQPARRPTDHKNKSWLCLSRPFATLRPLNGQYNKHLSLNNDDTIQQLTLAPTPCKNEKMRRVDFDMMFNDSPGMVILVKLYTWHLPYLFELVVLVMILIYDARF